MFTSAGDGDFLDVRFADLPDLFLGADNDLSRNGFTRIKVPLIGLGGKTGKLVLALISRGNANAEIQIKDIEISESEDPDGDGLTTLQ